MAREKQRIAIPDYTLGEEICNAVSHGLGTLLGIAGLVLMLVRAREALAVTAGAVFGASMIMLYTMSCLYHALSPKTIGKRVLRVLDHCNVFLLVFGTYVPVSLLGVSGGAGWALFGVVAFFTVLGVVLTAADLERYQTAAVICELCSGWSILIGVPGLLRSMGSEGLCFLILGGLMYSVGAVLYARGAKKRYRHSLFHLFCLSGSFFHFWSIYQYLM